MVRIHQSLGCKISEQFLLNYQQMTKNIIRFFRRDFLYELATMQFSTNCRKKFNFMFLLSPTVISKKKYRKKNVRYINVMSIQVGIFLDKSKYLLFRQHNIFNFKIKCEQKMQKTDLSNKSQIGENSPIRMFYWNDIVREMCRRRRRREMCRPRRRRRSAFVKHSGFCHLFQMIPTFFGCGKAPTQSTTAKCSYKNAISLHICENLDCQIFFLCLFITKLVAKRHTSYMVPIKP